VRLFSLLFLVACADDTAKLPVAAAEGAAAHDTGADDTEAGDTAEPASDDTASTDTGAPGPEPEEYTLVQVAAGALSGTGTAATSLVNPINEYTYVLDDTEGFVRYLTQAYVHPMGEWCLEAACTDSDLYTPGRLQAARDGTGMCLDEDGGRLFVARPNGDIQFIDVAVEGVSADTYNRTTAILPLPSVLSDVASFGGPCAYVSGEDALLVSDGATGSVALVDVGTLGLRTVVEAGSELGDVVVMADETSAIVALPQLQSIAVLQLPELTMEVIDIGLPVEDIAVDVDNGVVWVAHGESPGLSRVDLADRHSGPVPVAGALDSVQVAYDPSTGLVLASDSVDARSELVLVQGAEVIDRMDLPMEVLDIARPSRSGDFVAVVRDLGGQLGFVVLDASRPVMDGERPPVHAFVMAAIEQPIDANLDALESGELSCDFVDEYVAHIEQNTAALRTLDVSVAVSITHNFVRAVDFCGQLEILDLLEGAGFELGYMVHNRPVYNCTNVEGWDEADSCSRLDENFCDPEVDECSFPGDEGYCALGDQDCYQDFLDERSLYTEGLMPSGASFVLGADKSGHWGWDWVDGYRNMARPGDVFGHELTAFGHLWAYSDQLDLMDSRGKNAAPWRAAHSVEAWAIGYADAWDQDSAFSDLVYMPGNNTSVLKLQEQHEHGLFLLDLFESSVRMSYSEGDFQVLNQLLRRAVNLRGEVGPNVWYFHLHDLSQVNLADSAGEEMMSLTYMSEWVELVQATQVASGHVQWSSPTAVRAAWNEVR